MAEERVIKTEHIYQGRIVSLRIDTIAFPDGGTASREIVEHGDVIAVVPVDDEGNLVLVQQYRLATGQTLLEIPAGGIDPGETPEQAVQRELQEETGFRADHIERLTGFYVAPGYCTEYIHLYLATGLQPSQLRPDSDERIEVTKVSLAHALDMVASGEIKDAKSIIGLLYMARLSSR